MTAVPAMHGGVHDTSFSSFYEILEKVKYAEGDESADDPVFTSDEESDNETSCDISEALFCSNRENEFASIVETRNDSSESDSQAQCKVETSDTGLIGELEVVEINADKSNDSSIIVLPTRNKRLTTKNRQPSHLKSRSKINKQGQKPTSECGICQKTFKRNDSLVRHMFIHTGEKPYECKDCGKTFRQRSALKRHRLYHHTSDDNKLKCTECDKAFSTLHYFRQHLNIHNGVRFPCTMCNKSFSAQGTLKTHLQLHNDMNKSYVTCSICEKVFTSKINLNLHMETHEGTQQLACDVCDARFSRKPDLQRHMHIHTGEKPLKCSLCPKAFRHPGDLGRHMAWHRGDYTCKYCGRRYARKDELLRHVNKHEKDLETSQDLSLQCKKCHKFFQNQNNLQLHYVTHTRKQTTHTCDDCGKTFTTRSNYNRHMREIHNVILNSDTRKERVQSQDGPYECDLCSKLFKNKRALTEHVARVHLKIATHVCNICDKSFCQRKYLKKHMEKYHAEP